MVSTCAARQAESTAAGPAEKLIIAGTRPALASAKNVTAAPLALGSISPTGFFGSGRSVWSFRPRMLAPITRRE